MSEEKNEEKFEIELLCKGEVLCVLELDEKEYNRIVEAALTEFFTKLIEEKTSDS